MANNRYLDMNLIQKQNIQQILLSKEPGTRGFTTPTIQKLLNSSLKFDKNE